MVVNALDHALDKTYEFSDVPVSMYVNLEDFGFLDYIYMAFGQSIPIDYLFTKTCGGI